MKWPSLIVRDGKIMSNMGKKIGVMIITKSAKVS